MQNTLPGRAIGYVRMAREARKIRGAVDEIVEKNARRHLALRMGRLRGLPQKVGQILSMSADQEQAESFANLRERAEPLAIDEIQSILREAWGADVREIVRSIEREGRPASLGQVHRAVLKSGREVAIKVQYPGIRKAVMNDLKMLGWLSAPLGDLRRGFDLAGYRAEILRDLGDELDYRAEARFQRRFDRLAAETIGWTVPRVIDELSSETVLVSEWIDGDEIERAAEWPMSMRIAIAQLLVRGFFRQLFGMGILHADPHPGNYRFVKSDVQPQVVLYDYGSVLEVPLPHRIALLKLIDITMRREGDPMKPLLELGFRRAMLEPIRGKLAALFVTLLEPFCTPGKYDVTRWNLGRRVDDILGDDRWNFRMSGPAWMIFIMRAFRGLAYYLEKLDAPVVWSTAIRPYLELYAAALDDIDASAKQENSGSFEGLARHLRIRVLERGEAKVALTFPAASLDNIDELMDEGLRKRIDAHGIDLVELVRSVRRSAYAPQELFRLQDDGPRDVRVWLE